MTKKIKVISSILTMMFIFILISTNITETVKADTVSNEVEQMLNEIVNEYGSENIVFENGIIININEEVNLEELSQGEDVVWTIRNNSIANITENKVLTGLEEGTTFLVGQANGKYHLRELYVADPEEMISTASYASQRGNQYVVYLDPGHGGSDPGTSGNGIIEKELVLKIALEARRQLENAGVRVIMSRESDVYVSLKERSHGANSVNPDIFVSVHANSSLSPSAYGIESFYMKDIDYQLAKDMQRRLMQYMSTADRGVKYENFHVIRETKMPATLVEVGFVSNPNEANKLKQPYTQNALAEAITNGAVDYLKSNVSPTSIYGERIYGSQRYETSYKLFEQGWNTSDSVVLASGVDYPDALAAAPLAGKNNAPILLVRNSSLSSQAELKALLKNKSVKTAFIVGGTNVITGEIDKELTDMGISVKRLGGIDRYETATLIAKEIGINNGEISIVNGRSFADGLSMSSIAAKHQSPILLTKTDELPETTKVFLNDNSGSISKTYVIGQTTVVSNNVEGQLKKPERLGGINRYETNKNILDRFKGELDLSTVYIASGFTFPDSLASSALAGKNNNFVMLSHTERAEEFVKKEISENRREIRKAYILGSNTVISDKIIIDLGISRVD